MKDKPQNKLCPTCGDKKVIRNTTAFEGQPATMPCPTCGDARVACEYCKSKVGEVSTLICSKCNFANLNELAMVRQAKINCLEAEIAEAKKVIEDVKLELSCPETTGLDDEPLYKVAALVACIPHNLREQLAAKDKTIERLREHIKVAIDDLPHRPDSAKDYLKHSLVLLKEQE